MITLARSVNFGATKGSLATVGYTLQNYDGSVHVARVTAGIVEIVTGKGVYAAQIDFTDGWSGFVVWDTGEGTPVYAVDQFDYRTYQSYAPIYNAPMVDNRADLAKILKLLTKIMKAIGQFSATQVPFNDSLKRIVEAQNLTNEDILGLKTLISSQKPVDLTEISEGITTIGDALVAILDADELDRTLTEIENA